MHKKRTRRGPKYAPRLRNESRIHSTSRMDPLHRRTIQVIAKESKTTFNFVLDGILLEYFRMFSPRYGEEY